MLPYNASESVQCFLDYTSMQSNSHDSIDLVSLPEHTASLSASIWYPP